MLFWKSITNQTSQLQASWEWRCCGTGFVEVYVWPEGGAMSFYLKSSREHLCPCKPCYQMHLFGGAMVFVIQKPWLCLRSRCPSCLWSTFSHTAFCTFSSFISPPHVALSFSFVFVSLHKRRLSLCRVCRGGVWGVLCVCVRARQTQYIDVLLSTELAVCTMHFKKMR